MAGRLVSRGIAVVVYGPSGSHPRGPGVYAGVRHVEVPGPLPWAHAAVRASLRCDAVLLLSIAAAWTPFAKRAPTVSAHSSADAVIERTEPLQHARGVFVPEGLDIAPTASAPRPRRILVEGPLLDSVPSSWSQHPAGSLTEDTLTDVIFSEYGAFAATASTLRLAPRAMAAGLPVLLVDSAEHRSFLGELAVVAGTLVPPGQWASAWRRFGRLSDAQRRQQGRLAAAHIAATRGWDVVCERVLVALEQALAHRGRPIPPQVASDRG